MTPQQLVDAVRPCLPLPGIDVVSIDHYDHDNEPFGWVSCNGYGGRVLRGSEVVGAIVQECARREWVATMTPHMITVESWAGRGSAQGTDAIAWCDAYRKAKDATDGEH